MPLKIHHILLLTFCLFLVFYFCIRLLSAFFQSSKESMQTKKGNKHPSLSVGKKMHPSVGKEGFDNATGVGGSGYGSGAAGLAATIKVNSGRISDAFLLSKYRNDYDNVIINLHDWIQAKMLDVVLNINLEDDTQSFQSMQELGSLNQSLVALDNIMKYVDTVKN
jgi:hypothetical protein